MSIELGPDKWQRYRERNRAKRAEYRLEYERRPEVKLRRKIKKARRLAAATGASPNNRGD